jgi:flagellar basal-body rod modification protein FlgD
MSSIAFQPQVSSPSPTNTGNSSTNGVVNSTTASSEQDMFLQLLVSELQNQDPMNPVQGTDFVTQLAQFQNLSQAVTTGQDVSAIRTDLDQLVPAQSTTTQS